jgi:hypothetical protein
MEHAEIELRSAGLLDEGSDYGEMLGNAVLDLVRVFSDQGHSGTSAAQTLKIFSKVAAFEPLVPLTGGDDEWNEVGEGVFQNRRCSHVFKEGGEAYDIRGRIFREPSGACFTSQDSRVPVVFPYTPSTEYFDVPETPT